MNTSANEPGQGAAVPTTVPPKSPGDDAPVGTPGTGEDVCPQCGGEGRSGDRICTHCSGTGRVNVGIGGG